MLSHCFIIAEAGVNHNGSLKIAKKLIKSAKDAGADAVKFQTWRTEEILTRNAPKVEYQKNRIDENETMFEMIKKLELDERDFMELNDYAKKVGIAFLSTPEDKISVDLLSKLNVPAYKIGSGDLTNYPLLKYIAKKGKPIFLSTGMSYLNEVREAVEVIENAGNNKIVLLHCTTNYPTKLEDINLRAMITLKKEFNLPIGYSDHSPTIGVPIIARCLGANIIEKHLTLNKKMLGSDHKSSLEFLEFKKMVGGIRIVEKQVISETKLKKVLSEISKRVAIEKSVLNRLDIILGSYVKKPTQSEIEMIGLARKFIVATKNIKRGTIITKDMMSIKKSNGGLNPKHLNSLIGKKTIQNIEKDTSIHFEQVEN